MKYGILWRIKTLCWLTSLKFIIKFVTEPMYRFGVKHWKKPYDRCICRLILIRTNLIKRDIDFGVSNILTKKLSGWQDKWYDNFREHGVVLNSYAYMFRYRRNPSIKE